MAEIWFAKAGDEPTCGDAQHILPLGDCINRLGLKQSDYLSDLKTLPRFDGGSARDGFVAPRYVVVEVAMSEALALGWKAGFYGPMISVAEAQRLLSA
jgi:hypothetical protein